MNNKLYIIKGTGLNLDGQVVKIVGGEGDYVVVSPPNVTTDIQNTMVKRACLQPVNESGEKISYEISISKYYGVYPNTIPNKNFSNNIWITDALRDVDVDTIVEYLETNLMPILRME